MKLTAKSVVTGKMTVGIKYNHLPFLPFMPHEEKQCITITHCQYQQFHLIIHLSLTDMFSRKCKRAGRNAPISFIVISVLFHYQFVGSPFS